MVTLIDAMKDMVVNALDEVSLKLLDVTAGESKDENGITIPFKRFEVEVPVGFEELSYCRFTVKIPESKVELTQKDIRKGVYTITFTGLEVSYISDKGSVYFRATDAKIVKEG